LVGAGRSSGSRSPICGGPRAVTLLGVVALAVGTGGLTLVAAITWAFHGTITGTLLGDAVSVRVRDVDLVAVVATLLVGLVAVGDVLYLNVRDRAAELAVLRASGWSTFALGRLIVYEGLGIGLLGAAIGAGLSLLAAVQFTTGLTAELVRAAGVVALSGALLAAAAATVPALLLERLPLTPLLAEE
jgi:ABC-type antimicrobial peptide transport system permease subunit